MKPFVPPDAIQGEFYEDYFKRFLIAMKEHYEEFIKELHNDKFGSHTS